MPKPGGKALSCDVGCFGARDRPSPDSSSSRSKPTCTIKALTNFGSNSSQRPRRSVVGNTISPKRVRIRRLTVKPTDSNIRRTSRLRPSLSVMRYQRLLPSPPKNSIIPKLAGPSSSSTPSSKDWRCCVMTMSPERVDRVLRSNPHRTIAPCPQALARWIAMAVTVRAWVDGVRFRAAVPASRHRLRILLSQHPRC